MILERDDITTAMNRGIEEIASLQLEIAKRSRISGDINIFNQKHMQSIKLYSFITAMDEIPLNHSVQQNDIIERLYNNIKLITKDLRQWN
jgi:hypothetical protein